MTTTDPTALAEQIAREHHLDNIEPDPTEARVGSAVCECGQRFSVAPGDYPERVIAAHIATVTERAVRERVAADLKEKFVDLDPAEFTGGAAYVSGVRYGLTLAHTIANGAPDA